MQNSYTDDLMGFAESGFRLLDDATDEEYKEF
jgi:hypothetical protein